MESKKARVCYETQGLDKKVEQLHFKPSLRETQPVLEFIEPQPKKPKNLGIIECYQCKRNAELDGYRFRLVPLCGCCRTEREVEITNQRFEQRMRKYE